MILSQSIPRFAPATLHQSAAAVARVAGRASSHSLSSSTRRALSVVAMGKSGVPDAADSATEGVSLLSKKAAPKFDVYVKGSPEKGELGDCPFSHRLMLTLEEKDIPYNKILVNELDIPEWVGGLFDGTKTVPWVFEHEKSKWLIDSDAIIPHVEQSYPGKKLGDPKEVQQVGSKLLPSLVEFLKAKRGDPGGGGGSDLARKLEDLEGQIAEVEEGLQKSGGPFLGGQDLNAADVRVAPQLKHALLGGKAIHGWTLPEKFTAVKTFLAEIEKRPSWKATYYKPEYVENGWKKKLEVMGAL